MHTTEWDRDLLRESLTEIMNAADLTQATVGELAGRDRTMASRWLKGRHQPNWEAVSRFAAAVVERRPDLVETVEQFVAAAGYKHELTGVQPTSGEGGQQGSTATVGAQSRGRTLGDVLVERGLRARHELGPGDQIIDDPTIDELLANDHFDDQFKNDWLLRYSDMRQEVFKEEEAKRKPRDP